MHPTRDLRIGTLLPPPLQVEHLRSLPRSTESVGRRSQQREMRKQETHAILLFSRQNPHKPSWCRWLLRMLYPRPRMPDVTNIRSSLLFDTTGAYPVSLRTPCRTVRAVPFSITRQVRTTCCTQPVCEENKLEPKAYLKTCIPR